MKNKILKQATAQLCDESLFFPIHALSNKTRKRLSFGCLCFRAVSVLLTTEKVSFCTMVFSTGESEDATPMERVLFLQINDGKCFYFYFLHLQNAFHDILIE